MVICLQITLCHSVCPVPIRLILQDVIIFCLFCAPHLSVCTWPVSLKLIIVCPRMRLAAWGAHQNEVPPLPAWILSRAELERLEIRPCLMGIGSSRSIQRIGLFVTHHTTVGLICGCVTSGLPYSLIKWMIHSLLLKSAWTLKNRHVEI